MLQGHVEDGVAVLSLDNNFLAAWRHELDIDRSCGGTHDASVTRLVNASTRR